ncbi:MAG: hypothetical protein ACLFTQ_03005 [Candidatus Aenigmatarchaeota archaeon]
MKYGWQLEEEGPIFVAILLLVFGVLHYTTELGIGPNFGVSFLVAAIVTSLLVIIHSYKRDKPGDLH